MSPRACDQTHVGRTSTRRHDRDWYPGPGDKVETFAGISKTSGRMSGPTYHAVVSRFPGSILTPSEAGPWAPQARESCFRGPSASVHASVARRKRFATSRAGGRFASRSANHTGADLRSKVATNPGDLLHRISNSSSTL